MEEEEQQFAGGKGVNCSEPEADYCVDSLPSSIQTFVCVRGGVCVLKMIVI